MKILIVDDNADDRDILRTALRKSGHSVFEATDGIQALEMFDKDRDFDLIITDNIMACMNGVEIILPIKEMSRNVRVWLVSGQLRPETIDTATARGAEQAVQKQSLKPLLKAAGILDN